MDGEKDPAIDDDIQKSAKRLARVEEADSRFVLNQQPIAGTGGRRLQARNHLAIDLDDLRPFLGQHPLGVRNAAAETHRAVRAFQHGQEFGILQQGIAAVNHVADLFEMGKKPVSLRATNSVCIRPATQTSSPVMYSSISTLLS